MQLEHSKDIPEMVQQKSNSLNEYQQFVKYLDKNIYIHNFIDSLYSDVVMIYPISSWTFWYKNPKKLQLKKQWTESLTKIETVQDITHLWK